MVVNGACKHKDMDHFHKYLASPGSFGDVKMEYQPEQQLLALQVINFLLLLSLESFLVQPKARE